MENEVEKIHGETYLKLRSSKKEENGYLICNSCLGYYKLKEDESPEDFKGCECGSPLEYIENIDDLRKNKNSNPDYKSNFKTRAYNDSRDSYYDEYEELQQIVDIIRIKSQERKKFLEKLQRNIQKQEIILNNIDKEKIRDVKDNDWSLWGVIEEKDIKTDINKQKKIIDEISEQETLLLSYVNEKRNKKLLGSKSINFHPYMKLAILALVIVFLSLLVIYIIR